MKRLVLIFVVVAALVLAFAAGRGFAPVPRATPGASETDDAAAGQKLYQCSMHPQIVSDEPGNCPICEMQLEPVEQTVPSAAAATASGRFSSTAIRCAPT